MQLPKNPTDFSRGSVKCDECGGEVELKQVDFSLYGESLGKFQAEVCKKCGETLFTEQVSDLIDQEAKRRGLWGLESKTKAAECGTALAMRFSKQLEHFFNIKKGVDLRVYPESKDKGSFEIVRG